MQVQVLNAPTACSRCQTWHECVGSFFFRGRRLPDTHFRCKAWRFFRHKTGHWTCKKSPNQPTMLGRLFTGHRFRDHFTSSLADGIFWCQETPSAKVWPMFGALDGNGFFPKKIRGSLPHPPLKDLSLPNPIVVWESIDFFESGQAQLLVSWYSWTKYHV